MTKNDISIYISEPICLQLPVIGSYGDPIDSLSYKVTVLVSYKHFSNRMPISRFLNTEFADISLIFWLHSISIEPFWVYTCTLRKNLKDLQWGYFLTSWSRYFSGLIFLHWTLKIMTFLWSLFMLEWVYPYD